MQDQIFIEGLQVITTIGVYDYEKTIKQLLILDVICFGDISKAAQNDDLADSLDYAAVDTFIHQFAASHSFNLVETFAERLAQRLLESFHLSKVSLKVSKPQANPKAHAVGVKITRIAVN